MVIPTRVGAWFSSARATFIGQAAVPAGDPVDASHEQAKALADAFPQLLLWADLDGRLLFLNRHYTQLTGQDRDRAVVDQSWRRQIHPEDIGVLPSAFQEGNSNGEFRCEFRLLHADGRYRWMLLVAKLAIGPGGRQLWYAGVWDVHTRVSAENELAEISRSLQERVAKQTAELARTEARYASLFSVSKIAFAEQEMADAAKILHGLKRKGVTDLAAYVDQHPNVLKDCVAAVRTVSVNEACMRMLGFEDVDSAVDRPVDRTADDIEAVLLRQFEMIFYDLESVDGRVVLIGANGRRVPVFYSVTRLSDERQLSSLIDVSTEERIEAMRLAAQEELARANRVATVGAFSASIAHELNQPIFSIGMDSSTGLRLLARDPPDIDAAIRVLERVSATTQRIATIVKHTHNQIKLGQQELKKVDLAQLVSKTRDLMVREMRELGIELKVDCGSEVRTVMGDYVDLQQVVINLINNARDSMAGAGDGKEIVVSLRTVGDEIELSVSDVGTGIRDSDFDRLFQPFFTTKQGGIGLGLQICLSTIQRFGGDMKAANRPNRGAVFSFRLPASLP